jgi:hypothetical protein
MQEASPEKVKDNDLTKTLSDEGESLNNQNG